ncbi:MAG: hypothetical protein DRJ05_16325 [Bacteroidetes bacterium]|nr:MAG: hypothetical protein DRJ05_16325 [Bacteroidota bacterium]
MYALTGDYNQAKSHYEIALSLNPDNITGLINYSALLLSQNDLEGAREYAVRASELDPGNIQVRILMQKIEKR